MSIVTDAGGYRERVSQDVRNFQGKNKKEPLKRPGKALEGLQGKKLEGRSLSRENLAIEKNQTEGSQPSQDNHIFVSESVFTSKSYSNAASRDVVVDGVNFSAEKVEDIRGLLEDLFSIAPDEKSALVYADYAKMGLAENAVRSYAEKNLTGEQAEVVNRVVSNYFDEVIKNEDELIRGSYTTYTVDDLYYGKRYDGTDEIIRKMRQFIKDMVANSNLPEQTKQAFANMSLDGPGMILSASNMELAGNIRSKFSTVNWNDDKERNALLEQYKDWMRPAYLELYAGSSKFTESKISEDLDLFSAYFEQANKAVEKVARGHINFQV